MPFGPLTRRAAVGSLGAFLSMSVVRRAAADPGVRFREIRIDASPLRARAGDPTADWVEQALPDDLARALSPYLAPAQRNGATLLARIQDVNFGQSGGRGGASGASQDSIQGVLIVARAARRTTGPNAPAGGRRLLPQRRRSGADRGSLPRARCGARAGFRRPDAGRTRSLTGRFRRAPRSPLMSRLPSARPCYSPPAMVGAGTDKTKPRLEAVLRSFWFGRSLR